MTENYKVVLPYVDESFGSANPKTWDMSRKFCEVYDIKTATPALAEAEAKERFVKRGRDRVRFAGYENVEVRRDEPLVLVVR